MGTAAGIYFAQQLVALNASAASDSGHPSFILYSDPRIPSRVDAYLHQATNPAQAIASSLDKLADLGADFGVVICNTAHIYFDEFQRSARLPLINMIDNVARHVAQTSPQAKVGLLATAATARSALYGRHLARSGVALVLPSPAEQELVSAAIFDPVFGIKATGNAVSARAQALLAEVACAMRAAHGIDSVLLGCTELSMAVPDEHWQALRVIDPVKLLARACLQRAGFDTLH